MEAWGVGKRDMVDTVISPSQPRLITTISDTTCRSESSNYKLGRNRLSTKISFFIKKKTLTVDITVDQFLIYNCVCTGSYVTPTVAKRQLIRSNERAVVRWWGTVQGTGRG